MRNRKELKFLCDERMLVQIENRIKTVMHRDPNQKGDRYNVRSIYFDSLNNTCYRENLAGVDRRNKYRIRIYNHDSSIIRAEIKTKFCDTTRKASAALTSDQFYAIMKCKSFSEFPEGIAGEALWKFVGKAVAEGFHPASIVEYERSAYISKPCNVRVTFDRNIAASSDYARFFEKDMAASPMLPVGMHVLEVKYDEFLPDYLLDLLKVGDMRRTSFSKYFQSRITLNGGELL